MWSAEWHWLITSDRSRLYHRDVNNNWKLHLLSANSHYRYVIIGLLCDEPSMDLICVTTTHTGQFLEIQNAIRTSSDIDRDNLIIFDAIQISEPKVDWFNTSMNYLSTTSYSKEWLINGTTVGVSDSYYFPILEVGACGWIIATPDGIEWIESGGVIPGLLSDQNNYKSELGGQLGIATFVASVNLPKGDYVLKTICDGLSAVNCVGLYKSHIKSSFVSSEGV